MDAQGSTLTVKELKRLALDRGGYATPELNDVLFVHFGGYSRLENLEDYTQLKALYAESNGLSELAGIGHLAKLRSLFVQNNLIHSLGHGLVGLDSLISLNLANNQLASLDGLSAVASTLQTLNVSKNRLSSVALLADLALCTQLTSLDLSDNELPNSNSLLDIPNGPIKMTCGGGGLKSQRGTQQSPGSHGQPSQPAGLAPQDPSGATVAEPGPQLQPGAAPTCDGAPSVLSVLQRLPHLGALYLSGNPLSRTTRHYRRVVVGSLHHLRFLDDRPVDALERAATAAWCAGGPDAERVVRLQHEAAEHAAARARNEGFKRWQEDVRARRAAAAAAVGGAQETDGADPSTTTSTTGRTFVSYTRLPRPPNATAEEDEEECPRGVRISDSDVAGVLAPDASRVEARGHADLLAREAELKQAQSQTKGGSSPPRASSTVHVGGTHGSVEQEGRCLQVSDLLPGLEPAGHSGDAEAGEEAVPLSLDEAVARAREQELRRTATDSDDYGAALLQALAELQLSEADGDGPTQSADSGGSTLAEMVPANTQLSGPLGPPRALTRSPASYTGELPADGDAEAADRSYLLPPSDAAIDALGALPAHPNGGVPVVPAAARAGRASPGASPGNWYGAGSLGSSSGGTTGKDGMRADSFAAIASPADSGADEDEGEDAVLTPHHASPPDYKALFARLAEEHRAAEKAADGKSKSGASGIAAVEETGNSQRRSTGHGSSADSDADVHACAGVSGGIAAALDEACEEPQMAPAYT